MPISTVRVAFLLAVATLGLAGCGRSTQDSSQLMLRSLTTDEALEDFAALKTTFTRLYGPYDYKERRFGYSIAANLAATEQEIANANGDAAIIGAMKKFLATLQDGHVGIDFPMNSMAVNSYDLPFLVVPVDGHYLVGAVAADGPVDEHGWGIARGDEILRIDGKTPAEILAVAKKYRARGNALSDEHFAAWTASRPSYATEILPATGAAEVHLRRAPAATDAGIEYTLTMPWKAVATDLATVDQSAVHAAGPDYSVHSEAGERSVSGTVEEWGARAPFFSNVDVKAALNWTEVRPAEATLTALGLKADELNLKDGSFAIFAARYDYQGKKILFIRNPTYTPDLDEKKMVLGYAALIDEFQTQADVLVLDQTHNPGGSIDYATNFFSLFVQHEARNMVQVSHADRKWIASLLSWATDETSNGNTSGAALYKYQATRIEAAIDADQKLAEPMALVKGNTLPPRGAHTWAKPVLLLIDEMSGSCGDIVPMLFKNNGMATLFGRRTMGLGGNVEQELELPNSRAKLRVTRGLFTTYKEAGAYTDADYVENNGVEPDVPYTISVDDFRKNFVPYAKGFSDEAAKL